MITDYVTVAGLVSLKVYVCPACLEWPTIDSGLSVKCAGCGIRARLGEWTLVVRGTAKVASGGFTESSRRDGELLQAMAVAANEW